MVQDNQQSHPTPQYQASPAAPQNAQPRQTDHAAQHADSHEILFPKLPYNMHKRAEKAVEDSELQQSVLIATESKDKARRKTCTDAFGDKYDQVREFAGTLKQHALDNLDYYLKQFIGNARQRGAVVHFARDGREASDIALKIAQDHGCKTCVKSKSMVTEEIGLLEQLEAVGIETIETDLGEYILQIDHDAPSHIVTPMIHKNRQQVGRAFERTLGVDYTEDPQELTQIAREHLREKFRTADLGIVGGNFMVASHGTVTLCTNEGNGRMCSTLPPVLISCVGIEKMVANYEHLGVLLKLLARSSTGQPLTVYTQMLNGTRHAGEPDGPEHFHIILVDNGRSEVLGDPELNEMLRCIRCGACLNACPVYRQIGGHSYGAVYSGPIGKILTPMLRGLSNYPDLPNASSLCGACFEACPVYIDIPKHLIHLRTNIHQRKISSPIERLTFKLYTWSIAKRWRYRIGQIAQRIFLRSVRDKDGYVSWGIGPIKGWTDQRDLPAPAERNFRAWYNEHRKGKA